MRVQGKRLVVSLIATLPGNRGGTSAVAFDPTRAALATGGVEGGVRLWDASRTNASSRSASISARS